MTLPPFETGAVNVTVACESPAVAMLMVGAPGTVALIVSEIVALVKLACVAVLLSVPATVNVNVPAAVGVPVMAPPVPSARPGGRAPLATVVEKPYGVWPPLAVRLWLEAAPTPPDVSVVGVTVMVGADTATDTVAALEVPLPLVAV